MNFLVPVTGGLGYGMCGFWAWGVVLGLGLGRGGSGSFIRGGWARRLKGIDEKQILKYHVVEILLSRPEFNGLWSHLGVVT